MTESKRPKQLRRGEQILAKPFSDWLNERYVYHERRLLAQGLPITQTQRSNSGANGVDCRAMEAVAEEIGWNIGDSKEPGVRRLYRYRNQLMAGSVNRVRYERPTDFFPRKVVEEALHSAGIGMWELYPELVEGENIELEPDEWCPKCEDTVTPIDGVCPWCELRLLPDLKEAA